jgi:hypothetical protein
MRKRLLIVMTLATAIGGGYIFTAHPAAACSMGPNCVQSNDNTP